MCSNCVVTKQFEEINALKDKVESLTSVKTSDTIVLKSLESKVSELSKKISDMMISFGSPIDKTSISDPLKLTAPIETTSVSVTSDVAAITLTKSSKVSNVRVNFYQDRKFNIVLYGVEESPLHTPRSKRMQDDSYFSMLASTS